MIIIFCPRSNATGGTELLHQLGYKLRLFGYDARINYFGDEDGRPRTHPYFEKYRVPEIDKIVDERENIFIYPESVASSFESIKSQLPLSKHVLWWLSVDNAEMTSDLEREISGDNSLIHFVQSYYALDYVRNVLSIPNERLFYLSDYINNNFLNMDSSGDRDNIVLFNPRKGFERTARLIGNSDMTRINWRELAGLAPDAIPGILQKAKVYIDFGNHPGKDRFPREAVSCGCRIITGRKGSAANDRDIPIPDQFKVSDDLKDDVILDRIYALVDEYEQTGKYYEDYKKMIDEEFHEFEADVLSVFSKITDSEMAGAGSNETELKNRIIDAVMSEDYRKAFYYLTVYRIEDYSFDTDMTILEGYTRLGIGEDQVAIYLMNKLLMNDGENYEAYLIKTRALLAIGSDGAREASERAVMYSSGTADEEYIRDAVRMLMG